ncbi:SGNH/GDSL hydrolase family protein [Adhaeribacter pallidiroseus]|uniref:Sialate O-acetylesterase n=1 Tax=Adhaeribacter pallidiroseus TaxID=2072847 RepID=A0A369QA06_9BACT|nr:SGNH/GDSL hydrolase family protein [Adhaeribacter pallidiroseus]RDC61733.1 Sialate O-acetylesterase [Adhaeribacter pallidiroseus]
MAYLKNFNSVFICLLIIFPDAFLQAQDLSKWEKEIAAFEQQDKVTPPARSSIVFTGSSSIRLWETLDQDFPGKHVLNRGFGGSQTFEVLHFADRLILPYHPKQVVIYVGDNDLAAGKTPNQVFTDFKALFQKIKKSNPKTNVTFISIKPSPSRKNLLPAIKQTNQLVRAYLKKQQRTDYVDVYTRMLLSSGKFNPKLYRADSLHMTDAGYRIWAEAVRPVLK